MEKKLRFGFTTGSCAAAAAKAAAFWLLSGTKLDEITIQTPKGIPYRACLEQGVRGDDWVSFGVRKDGGDDPDVTTGSLICARVSLLQAREEQEDLEIHVEGGPGVGRVTRPGLDQPVGQAAINRVPRQMIEREVREVCQLVDFHGLLSVEISVPGGEALAAKTFNPRLGIEGGISILGTTGVVEPMSEAALLETIRLELTQRRAAGADVVAVSPGNYGLEYMRQTYGYDLDKSVKCSNFIGSTLDMAMDCGFTKLLLTGHVGKLIKLSGGMMNTHSREGDCRMELLAAAALRARVDLDPVRRILDCVVTDEALPILEETGRFQQTMELVMERMIYYLRRRCGEQMQVECILYSNAYGELASSSGAKALLEEILVVGQE